VISGSVLVIDDDAFSLKLMRDCLTARGYEVEVSSTGEGATNLILDLRPDLLILDVGLPGMGGLEILQSVRAHPQIEDLPVLIVTAYAMPADEERIVASGCDDYLFKPLGFEEFIRRVEALLSGPPRHQTPAES